MATQLAITPIIKGKTILEIISEVNAVKSSESYENTVKNLEKVYMELENETV